MNWGKGERRDFPALAAYVADDAGIELAVNRREPAYYSSDTLRAAARTLGNLLFPAAMAAAGRRGAAGPGRQAGAGADSRVGQEPGVRSQESGSSRTRRCAHLWCAA